MVYALKIGISVSVFVLTLAACGSDDRSTGGSANDSDPTDNVSNSQPSQDPPPSQPSEPVGLKNETVDHHFTAWLDGVPPSMPAGEKKQFSLTVWNADRAAATGLRVGVSFIHEAMGHGSSMVPVVEEIGDGKYAVKNVMGSMRGTWLLGFRFKSGATQESLTYSIGVQ